MKRLSYVAVLCLFLFTVCFQTIAMATNISDADVYPMAEGDSISANSISIWGNYIFASTIDNGLEIIDMEDNSVVAKWNLSSTMVIPGLGSFSSIQTVVTDEYIICANNLYVVVFPNEGRYTDTPPEMIARITPNPSNATRTFNRLKRMFVKDGFLYLFDLSAKNQISEVDKAANKAVVWKVPLSSLENISYVYEGLKWTGLEEGGLENVDFAVLGEYQYFWETIKIDENYAYCITYNNEDLLPKKTMFLNMVNLDTLECETGEIMQNDASGLQTEFEAEGLVTMEDIRALELYVARVEETEYVPLSSFLDVENTEYLMVDIDYNEETNMSNVKIMFSEDVISALVDIYQCDENQIVNNGIVFAVDYIGMQHEFVYITNDACYDSGVIAIDEDKPYVFVMTGEEAGDNYIIPVNINDGMEVRSKKVVTPIGDSNIAIDALCMEGQLIALYKGVDSRAAVYDVSTPENIPYNFIRNLHLGSGIYLSNTLSQLVKYGNKYYYADLMGEAVGVLNTDESAVFSKIWLGENVMPVRVYGYNSGEESVDVVLDGNVDDVIAVPVINGVWSYTVGMAENGEHTIDVLNGEREDSFSYSVDMELPVTITEVGYNDDDELKAVITNNTDKYETQMNTTVFDVVAVLYDEDGVSVTPSEQSVEIGYGESLEVVFSDIWGMDVEDYNGTVKIYVLDQSLAPVAMSCGFDGTETAKADVPTVSGRVKAINLDTPAIDANNKTITISGVVDCDGTRPVALVISKDGWIYDVNQAECDDDGGFSFTYSYANDSINGEGTYDVAVNAMMGGADGAISEQVVVMDSDVFNEKLTYIVENITTGEELLEYLDMAENDRFAREAGMNLEDANFAALSEADKKAVMNECLEIIKSGDRSTLALTYKNTSADLKLKADKAEAVKAINDATKASLYGVLVKYKDLIEISDSVWNKYSKHSDIVGVNKYFVKKDITDLSEVEGGLTSAMKKFAEEDDEGGSDKVTGSSGVGTGYKVPPQQTEIKPVNPEEVYNPDEVSFKDLDSVPWAKEAIVALAEEGIVNGIDRTTFLPDDNVTREQFIKMLVIAFDLEDNTAESSFKDADKAAWYYEYVAAAEKCGLAKGDGDSFGIGKIMTREEMATFAYRAAEIAGIELPEQEETQDFADGGDISDYAIEGISAMQKAGIINGMGDGMFLPKEGCSRAMAAKVIYELLSI